MTGLVIVVIFSFTYLSTYVAGDSSLLNLMRLDFSSAVSENLFGFGFLLLLSLISLSGSQEARWWREIDL
jgi:hypothetical protein